MKPLTDVESACAAVSDAIGWLQVLRGSRTAVLEWCCADVLDAQERGEDPTLPWREALARDLGRQHRCAVPAHVPATFVMQWYLQAIAYPVAGVAGVSPFVLSADPRHWSFELGQPGHYVAAAMTSEEFVVPAAQEAARWTRAEQGYRAHARRFLDSYAPGVRISSRQRTGSANDMWAAARDAIGSARGREAPDRWRESCCFIYALPGATECSRCPRLRRG